MSPSPAIFATPTALPRQQDRSLLRLFAAAYPDPDTELEFQNEYQLIVAVILSAQCTDKKVNEVTPALFEAYPDFGALADAKLADVEKLIRPVNYYRSKARNIVAMAQSVRENHRGVLPRERSLLEELAGVGRKTASVILSQLGIEPALPVDTHVFRVARRLGLADADERDALEAQLCTRFPKNLWHNLHHWLILHGRRVCKAQRPNCAECALRKLCPSAKLYSAEANRD